MRTVIHPNEVNEVMNCKKSVKSAIVPGMGATMYVGSDRYAMVVVDVISDKKIKVTYLDDDYDKLVEKDGIDYLPEEYLNHYREFGEYDPILGHSHGLLHTYTLRKNGRWMPMGSEMWGTCSIHIGKANNYMDPSF